ncbi:patatin-like protein [Actinoplanes bogorensis]|uniref:Patatin-like protein n=1 Tax=Paractinoplanes bogorensis TaxID=1610840 RepID=A0ABS5YGW3_9ACTN|nr:patatin-like protein [Actinoplanes bogorensis]MBU2662635.1 patatin-like protein [Actinoplanes bogorensis]
MTVEIPKEEIRFAVVLNGGVSLAVWMGGAVHEIDRVTRRDGPYAALLDLVGAEARADVISGTSAGGINGAALALAQINETADLRQLRELWAEQGDIDALLRTPFRGSPVSLLQGDEYFLPQLRATFKRLASDYRRRPPEKRPVDLTITTTLLHGAQTVSVDALGQKLPQSVHTGRFHFRHDSKESVPPGVEQSTDFDPKCINETVDRLALAARSTASFPFAFEPSYVPVHQGATPPGLGRPNMSAVASWADPGVDDRSRFAVDGGLLANTPTREALEAVDRLPGGGPVRRVMLLVYPHASATADETPDRPEDMPTVLESSGLLLGALSGQGSRTFVEEIDRHNRAAASRRTGRHELLASLDGGPEDLYDTADRLDKLYKQLRIRRASRDLAARVPPARDWPYERTRVCAERAQTAYGPGLPYLPQAPVPECARAIMTGGTGWAWGITTAEHLAETALDLYSRLAWVVADPAQRVSENRTKLFEDRLHVRKLRVELDRPWDTEAAGDPDEAYWRKRLDAYRDKMLGPAVIGEPVRAQVEEIARKVALTEPILRSLSPDQITLGELGPWRDLLTADAVPAERDLPDQVTRILARLLALEVLTTCLAEETETGMSQAVDLIQVSLMTSNPFARYSVTPADKGAGLALSRFGGFLKQSWRVNDWTWGRMDAAATLCRILLNPARLRRIAILDGSLPGTAPAALAERLLNRIDSTFAGGVPPQLVGLRRDAIAELIPIYGPDVPPDGLPAALHAVADFAIWSVQAGIAAEELPPLARAIRTDQKDGGNPRSRGVQFLSANEKLLETLSRPDPPAALGIEALAAFDRAGIGHETLGEEAASDRLLRTTVEAASVAVTVLDSGRSGLPVLKPVTRAVRGAALLPYFAIRGVTGGGGVAKFLALLGFSLGGFLVVLALLGSLPAWASGPAAAAGAGALLGAFAYGALRTGTMLHGVVLLAPVVPLVVYALTDVGNKGQDAQRGASVVLLVAVAALSLIILGSLPAVPPSPAVVFRRQLVRAWSRRRPMLVGAAVVAALAAAIVFGVPAVSGWLADQEPADLVVGAALTTGVVLVVMIGLAWVLGRRLGTWVETDGAYRTQFTVHPSGSAAGWSIVYAVVFLLAAIALVRWAKADTWRDTEPWMIAATVTAVVFATVLMLVVPWFAPWSACRRIGRTLVSEATPQIYRAPPPRPTEEALILRLQYTGRAYRYLLCTDDARTLRLTRAGQRISRAIDRKLTAPEMG